VLAGVKAGRAGEDRAAGVVDVLVEGVGGQGVLELDELGGVLHEGDLLSLLATGSDTRAMARRMSLSEHTVQDHLKSIFTKTGAHDRVTVLPRALGTRR
jgi:DNA-binding CsgD family transcriptional regulator